MAFVASSCSQSTWLLWPWTSSSFGKALSSFPLGLFAPADILKHNFSFLFDLVVRWGRWVSSMLLLRDLGFRLQCSGDSALDASSSGLVFVEARDSWDLDRVSPLKIILKWEVRGLSESSDLSWEECSLLGGSGLTAHSAAASSGGSEEGSHWEIMIVGTAAQGASAPFSGEEPRFSEGCAENSVCDDGIVISFGTSAWGLEVCEETKNNSGRYTDLFLTSKPINPITFFKSTFLH